MIVRTVIRRKLFFITVFKKINIYFLQSHEFDDCRIDLSVNNCVWYLRADNPEDKTHWIDVLQSYKVRNF